MHKSSVDELSEHLAGGLAVCNYTIPGRTKDADLAGLAPQ
jgi:hypothetical protein